MKSITYLYHIKIKQELMNTLKTLNQMAENMFGEFGFSTCTEEEQVLIIEELLKQAKK